MDSNDDLSDYVDEQEYKRLQLETDEQYRLLLRLKESEARAGLLMYLDRTRYDDADLVILMVYVMKIACDREYGKKPLSVRAKNAGMSERDYSYHWLKMRGDGRLDEAMRFVKREANSVLAGVRRLDPLADGIVTREEIDESLNNPFFRKMMEGFMRSD